MLLLPLSLQSTRCPLQGATADARLEDINFCGCAGPAEQGSGRRLSSRAGGCIPVPQPRQEVIQETFHPKDIPVPKQTPLKMSPLPLRQHQTPRRVDNVDGTVGRKVDL